MGIFVLTRARIAQVVILVGAVVAVLAGFDIVHWSTAQSGDVGAVAAAALVLIMAITQHFRPNTAEEPVAIGQAAVAVVASTTTLFVVFDFWLTTAQAGLLVALATVATATIAGWSARDAVTAKQTPPA